MLQDYLTQRLERWQRSLSGPVQYVLRSVPYLAASELVVSILRFALSVYLVRVLGEEGYGRYGYVISWLTMVSIMSLPGMDTAVSAAAARGFDGTLRNAVAIKWRWSALGSIALLGGGAWFWWKGDMQIALSLALSAIFFYGYFLSIYDNYLQGKQAFRQVFWLRLISNLIVVATSVGSTFFFRSVVATTVTFLATSAVTNWYLTRHFVNTVNDAPVEEHAVQFGKSITWIGVISLIASNLDRFMIQGRLGYAELAIYMIVTALPSQMRRAYGIVFTLIFPKVAQGSLYDAMTALKRRWLLIAGSLVATSACVAVVIPWLIPLVYGEQYAGAVWYAELYLLVPLLVTIYSIFTKVLLPAHKRGREMIKISVCEALSDFIWFALLIPTMGLLGAILAQILTAVIVIVYALYLSNKVMATSQAEAS